MREYIQNGTSLYKKVEQNKRVDYKTDIDEFEFKRTPETDAMLKQLCIKECFVRCKDCKYCEDESYTDEDTGKEVKYLVCDRWYEQDDADGNMFPKADDFCSRGERK